MSPTDVLSKPPQILMLPIADLEVPDWNPRKVIFEEPLKTLMAYIQVGGKVPRILVWKGNDQAPWAVISGQRRREAFKRLGHTQVEVEVMDIPLEQAKTMAMGSNEGEPVFWLDWDIRVEKLYAEGNQGDQKLSQADLAVRFGVTQARVSYALKVAKALTPTSRELIYNTVIKSGDPERVKERPILELAALGTPLEVEKALPQVLEAGMTMGQVRHMVATLKGGPLPGGRPVDGRAYPPMGNTPMGKPGLSQIAGPSEGKAPKEDLGKGVPSQGVEGTESPKVGSAVPAPAPAASPAVQEVPGQSGLQKLYGLFKSHPQVATGVAGAVGGFLASNLKRALGTLVRRYFLHTMAALGVLVVFGYHGFGNLFSSKLKTVVEVPATTKPSPPAEAGAGEGGVRGFVGSVPAQASAVAPAAPVVKSRSNKARVSAPKAPEGPTLPAIPATSVSKAIPNWSAEALPLVKDFTERFYNVSYQSWNSDLAYLKARLTDDYAPAFQAQYYPSSRKEDLQSHQEIQYFSKGQPPKIIGSQGNSVLYQVEGQITLQNRGGHSLQNLWSKPVALEISVRHMEGMGYRVEKVIEVTPGQAPSASAQGADPAAKFVGDAAGEAAKKLLGL